jgi:plastocyanin
MGKAYGQKRDYSKETEMYKKMLEFDPNFAQAHFNLGVVLSIRDKIEEAAPHFERAIELDKQFDQPFVTKMLKAMGRYKEPAKKLEKENTQVAKHEDHKIQDSLKKPEGSDTKGKGEHQMEGSSSKPPEKDLVKVKGKAMINGAPMGRNGVIFLETKTKLRVAGQKPVNVTVKQKNLHFEPMHTIVHAGSSVTFSNDDMEVHNIYSKSINNQFNLGAMAGGSSKTIKLPMPGPVVLRCNMHKDMIGTIFVVPNGYYTQPNDKGEYAFNDVSNQEYVLQAWHPSMAPEDVEKNLKSIKLDGKDEVFDFTIASASKPDEIHDMVNSKDYSLVADDIEKDMFEAIEDWKAGKNYASRNRMLSAITKHFEGEGLKDAITKSFSEKRSQMLEDKLDTIRKKISGLGPYADQKFTKEGLMNEAKMAMDQIRENVRELHNRLNPTQ